MGGPGRRAGRGSDAGSYAAFLYFSNKSSSFFGSGSAISLANSATGIGSRATSQAPSASIAASPAGTAGRMMQSVRPFRASTSGRASKNDTTPSRYTVETCTPTSAAMSANSQPNNIKWNSFVRLRQVSLKCRRAFVWLASQGVAHARPRLGAPEDFYPGRSSGSWLCNTK